MKAILLRLATNSFAIWIATLVIPQLEVNGDGNEQRVITFLVIGAIFGVLNTFLKPIIKLFAFPFYIFSLGLISFVVNAGLLSLTAYLAGNSFNVGSFLGGALPAAILISFISFITHLFLPDSN